MMLTDWALRFPGCEPIAHHLPAVFPDRWVRFHSLPDSKRYPENELEYATVLERTNSVLDDLAIRDEAVVLLTTGWSESPEPVRPQRILDELDPLARPWRTIAMHEQPDNFPNPTFWHVFMSSNRWSPGVFDPLIRLIAEDMLGGIMFVSPDCRWLLHPYDGGMDVVVDSHITRDGIAEGHKDWLAPEWLNAGIARDIGARLY